MSLNLKTLQLEGGDTLVLWEGGKREVVVVRADPSHVRVHCFKMSVAALKYILDKHTNAFSGTKEVVL